MINQNIIFPRFGNTLNAVIFLKAKYCKIYTQIKIWDLICNNTFCALPITPPRPKCYLISFLIPLLTIHTN